MLLMGAQDPRSPQFTEPPMTRFGTFATLFIVVLLSTPEAAANLTGEGVSAASGTVAVDEVSSGPCDLSMTLSCPPLQIGAQTTCTATTINNSTQACSGLFLTSMFSDAQVSAITLSGYDSGLGLMDCFTNEQLPGFESVMAFCFGHATLHGGGEFTQTVSITPTGTAPPTLQVGAMTIVFDEAAEEEKAFVVVTDELTVPGCVP